MQRLRLISLCALAGAGIITAQFAGDWTTTGFDAQRSFWVRSDGKISLDTMRKPGFELVWKANINEGMRAKSFVTPPVLIDFYIGYRGFRALGFVGNGANSVLALDTDLGRVEWKQDFKVPASTATTSGCPGGMTSGVARATTMAYPGLAPPRAWTAASPSRKAVA